MGHQGIWALNLMDFCRHIKNKQISARNSFLTEDHKGNGQKQKSVLPRGKIPSW